MNKDCLPCPLKTTCTCYTNVLFLSCVTGVRLCFHSIYQPSLWVLTFHDSFLFGHGFWYPFHKDKFYVFNNLMINEMQLMWCHLLSLPWFCILSMLSVCGWVGGTLLQIQGTCCMVMTGLKLDYPSPTFLSPWAPVQYHIHYQVVGTQ